MRTIKLFLIFIFLINATTKKNVLEIKPSNKIETLINAQKMFELQTYRIKGKIDDYVLLKDLSKIFSATLTYHPKSGYISFNYRGEKLYFYTNKNFFVNKKKRVYLSAENVMLNNKVYVPITILNLSEFSAILDAEINYQKSKNFLIINFIDNVILDYYVSESYAKINIYFKQQIHHEQYYKDKTLIVTVFGAKISPREYNIVNGVVNKISIETQNNTGNIKLFFSETNIHIKKEDYGDRVSYEIIKSPNIDVSSGPIFTETDKSKLYEIDASSEIVENIILPEKGSKFVIVIDPGHGGEDPGAIGPNGTLEKNVNLSIAKYLQTMLLKENYVVFITREDDTFIPLVERTKFANDRNADVFISIHCNAAMKRSGTDNGVEVYFLSENATDPQAVATEKLENEVIKFEKQTPELNKLQKILWSMVVNEFMNESSKLSTLILKEVVQRTDLANRGVKQAGFYVLRGAQMPAVLVECGFISNPYEEIKLNREDFQKAIASGIFAGIKNYEEYKNNK